MGSTVASIPPDLESKFSFLKLPVPPLIPAAIKNVQGKMQCRCQNELYIYKNIAPPPIFHWAQAEPTMYRDRSPWGSTTIFSVV